MATTRTPLFAVVGATDLAVERVRAAAAKAPAVQAQLEAKVSAVQADVEKRVSAFDAKALRDQVRDQAQEVPTRAAAIALETAGKAEAAYEELAKRGKSLVDRVRAQPSTQDLVNQAGNTLSRGRAAVTVARKAADETASAIIGTLTVGRREAGTVAGTVVEETTVQAETAVQKTQASAQKTATTTRKRAASTKSAAKGAATSANKTASKAGTATKSAAKKVGN